ncbi:hypothetical protein THAOC_16562, partial [Thalassiosira oceanica]
ESSTRQSGAQCGNPLISHIGARVSWSLWAPLHRGEVEVQSQLVGRWASYIARKIDSRSLHLEMTMKESIAYAGAGHSAGIPGSQWSLDSTSTHRQGRVVDLKASKAQVSDGRRRPPPALYDTRIFLAHQCDEQKLEIAMIMILPMIHISLRSEIAFIMWGCQP